MEFFTGMGTKKISSACHAFRQDAQSFKTQIQNMMVVDRWHITGGVRNFGRICKHMTPSKSWKGWQKKFLPYTIG